ncbi:fumarylacetoacetate hydrolase family protein [Erythrobacter dokdonensis]|uniref:Fumarylacetoacetate hydrolase-like protein n=1 Tax=Erythrobacter dokdonensis DSW-74 TaxID=1300349 RepID=A0A1A7BLR1_9SPHN|nr:fumarylacetoacetate hydrolase family protein [Erythrobacter dokdonensis]OBV12417.1 Fumarylacetoacetate hydrolase-like protein [Erythrobacter dokdonensis DSW-74]
MRKLLAALVALAAIGIAAAWATSPDPKGNLASFEEAALDPGLAPMREALTLARYRGADGRPATLLVTDFDATAVTGIPLAALGAAATGNPLRDLASLARLPDDAAALPAAPRVTLAYASLLPSAPGGRVHIGTGTNFPEHAAEANSGAVFQFPKFGTATPARATIAAQPGILLDYEVELCMRFDHDIASLADFDAALKGVFLCGDFTNRNALVELADPDNLDSGFGFSDAKSGPGHFPSGPFLVVPRDWKAFVADARMATSVNGAPRQDARGGEMVLDFRALAAKALGDMERPRFLYQGSFHPLAPQGKIAADMTLMAGTSEGVIFTPPTRGDMIEGVLAYLGSGGPMGEAGLVEAVKQRFIANELAGGHFLKPGDRVAHGSNHLGDIVVEVTAP